VDWRLPPNQQSPISKSTISKSTISNLNRQSAISIVNPQYTKSAIINHQSSISSLEGPADSPKHRQSILRADGVVPPRDACRKGKRKSESDHRVDRQFGARGAAVG